MSAGCNVASKSTPKSYPAFGERLFTIVSENLPDGVVKNKSSVVSFLRQQNDLGFDPSSTYAWLKGDVIGHKSLVAENFKRILLFYIGKHGLNTLEELNDWVSVAPEKFKDVLSDTEIQKKLLSVNILRHPDKPEENLTERRKIWNHLLDRVDHAAVTAKPQRVGETAYSSKLIIIQGPPGVGKSLFLKRLRAAPAIQARFDVILYASCDTKMSPQTFLDFCLRQILPNGAWHPGNPVVLSADLQKMIHSKKVLVLVDNLSTLEEIEGINPLCELGCLVVISTRCLAVARQAERSNVIELAPYSESDVREYYSKNSSILPASITEDQLMELADLVCFNPIGLDIALRRVVEEGWVDVVNKVNLATSFMNEDVYEDLHKSFWLAYSSLKKEDQEKFRRLGIIPPLACYDEERLSLLWGVSKNKANEILLRFEKEAGLVHRCFKRGCWHFHPQVLNYARYLHRASPLYRRIRSRLYPMRVALHEKRPSEFQHLYKRGVKVEVVSNYWQMTREEGIRRRVPILLAELRRLVDPSYSTDWLIFTRYISNCTLADYSWGYRNYLAGVIDIWVFFVYLALVGLIGGLQQLAIHYGLENQRSILFGILNLFLISNMVIGACRMMLRDLRRRYDWGQLWQKVSANHKEGDT